MPLRCVAICLPRLWPVPTPPAYHLLPRAWAAALGCDGIHNLLQLPCDQAKPLQNTKLPRTVAGTMKHQPQQIALPVTGHLHHMPWGPQQQWEIRQNCDPRIICIIGARVVVGGRSSRRKKMFTQTLHTVMRIVGRKTLAVFVQWEPNLDQCSG